MKIPNNIPLSDWKAKGSYFNFHDKNIFYIREGASDKPCLVLIHGFPTASWDWHKVWNSLLPHYQLLTFDLIGFGYSDKPVNYKYSLFEQADLAEALLQHCQFTNTHILSHDYGDTVVQEMLARQIEQKSDYPIEIQSVCMLNGGILPEVIRPIFMQKLLMSSFGSIASLFSNSWLFKRNLAKVYAPATRPSEEELNGYWTLSSFNKGHRRIHEVIQYMFERRDNRDRWVHALRDTPLPLLLINGAVDPVNGEHMVDRYKRIVRKYDIVMLRQIGHYPQTEDPESVVFALQNFHESLV